MRVRWTPAAADDFENIANYLFEQPPENAARLIRESPFTRLVNQDSHARERPRDRVPGPTQ